MRRLLHRNLGAKQPAETLDWMIRLGRSLGNGRTLDGIISAEVVHVPDSGQEEELPPALTISGGGDVPGPSFAEDNTALVFWTAGGSAGHLYKITFVLASSDVVVLELDCRLRVVEI